MPNQSITGRGAHHRKFLLQISVDQISEERGEAMLSGGISDAATHERIEAAQFFFRYGADEGNEGG